MENVPVYSVALLLRRNAPGYLFDIEHGYGEVKIESERKLENRCIQYERHV